ncbi:Nonribosomal peptide synthetase easA [Colletotrichum shisoi]|uniref:Nonribosomal peptide synthetase easA n=1 Tax=Colletotrichum shisoi TaxID=2078593 RepID=A0A5Q4BG78_9PEZI|nr:Nonribosomal peptide synthetase easA [Colletotrichum shisoi]
MPQAAGGSQIINMFTARVVDPETLEEIAGGCSVPLPAIEDVCECTALQTGTMTESTMHPNRYKHSAVFSVAPSVDLERLASALEKLVSLNPILRTRIVDTRRRGLLQVVLRERHEVVYSSLPLGEFLEGQKNRSMGLGTPLLHSAFVGGGRGGGGRRLVLTTHHAIRDETSTVLVLSDLARIYHNQEPEPHVPFREFVAFCRGIEEDEARAFWADSFQGESAVFPTPRAARTSATPLSEPFQRQRKDFSLSSGAPLARLPAYIEVAWALTASVYTNARAVAYGLVFSGRTPSFKSAIGPTAAVVPVQVLVDPSSTVQALLKERMAARRRLLNHPALQYGLGNIRRVSRDAQVAAGFQTQLNIIPRARPLAAAAAAAADSGVLRMEEAFEVDAQFALSLNCFLHADSDRGEVVFEADFDPATVPASQMRRILRQFVFTLSWLLRVPGETTTIGQFSPLNPGDVSEILGWNRNVPASSDECLHRLFKARARQQSSAPAVVAPDGTLTYGELDDLSDRLADHLRLRGVGLEKKVPLLFEKTMWSIVSFLGVMKAGGVCVPMDPSHPRRRIQDIVTRCHACLVLTSKHTEAIIVMDYMPTTPAVEHFTVSADSLGALPSHINTSSLPPPRQEEEPSPANAAYVLFTSGSTGNPKGVVLEHRNLASTLTHYGRRVGWEANGGGCRALQFSSFVWDTHTLEVFGTLLWGGCVCMPSEAQRADLESFIRDEAVEWAILTPTVLRTLDAHAPQVATVRTVVSCGEPVDVSAVRDWSSSSSSSPSRRFINEYGPCEVSGRCTLTELTAHSPFPESIGKPVDCAVWIVSLQDPTQLAPIGEIIVQGPGVARGYLDDEALTTASFISRPSWLPPPDQPRCDGSLRFYRTGDTARYNADGSMTFTGRRDGQVKIRGQRFELGEVERALVRSAGVREAVACVQPWRGSGNILTAVLSLDDTETELEGGTGERVMRQVSVPTAGHDLSRRLRGIRDDVAAQLPSYMVPEACLVVSGMPLTTSGKLDRASVMAWVRSQDMEAARAAFQPASADDVLTAPASDREKLLQSVWASVLDIPEQGIGRESNFLALGGDSIAAMRAANLLRKRGLAVPLQALVQSSNLAATTDHCEVVTELPGPAAAPLQPDDTPAVQDLRVEGFAGTDIEAVAEATDAQASMVALGELDPHALVLKTGLMFEPGVDRARIEHACRQVLQHHGVLRTVFVQRGPKLYQVVLKRPADSQIQPDGDERSHHQHGDILPRFHVASDGHGQYSCCSRLRLEIHHALYDAVSLGLVWKDIAAAYAGRKLSDGTSFLEWAGRLARLDHSRAKRFWREALQGSRLTYLVPPRQAPGTIKQVALRVSLRSLEVPGVTTANLFAAAWALVMGREAGTQDVAFAEILANRYSPSVDMDQENVLGPCMNANPVRARFDSSMTFVAVAARLQEQSLAAAPFAYLGYRTIQKDCTGWPLDSLFGSVVNFQSPRAVGSEEFDMGGSAAARVMPPAASPPSSSSALWTIARPVDGELVVMFNFSSAAFDEEKSMDVQGTYRLPEPSSREDSVDRLFLHAALREPGPLRRCS